jgi:hypothetical protein
LKAVQLTQKNDRGQVIISMCNVSSNLTKGAGK